MNFVAVADTDIGIDKSTNQDSVLVKHASYDAGEVMMAVICDGMGGLSKGELASATVIRAFVKWFEEELPLELMDVNMEVIAGKWELLIKELNGKIMAYSERIGESLGTTFTGMLLINDQYIIVHVGDTRVYHNGDYIQQLTTDHTFIARELARGAITPEQAKTDKRRNMLLQCVGASPVVTPQVVQGEVQEGVYLLCTDGFRHEISEQEIHEAFKPDVLFGKEVMQKNARKLIELVKERQEKDNISVIVVKVGRGD